MARTFVVNGPCVATALSPATVLILLFHRRHAIDIGLLKSTFITTKKDGGCAVESSPRKGRFTFRASAVLFVLSAAFELLSLTAEVPLFGEIRGGLGAGAYHLVYAGLFLALGIGLWDGKPWGYQLVFVTTALYTLDKLQLLLSEQTLNAFVKAQMGGFEPELQTQGITEDLILQAIVLMSIVVILCWWGFAFYVYWRREYFNKAGGP